MESLNCASMASILFYASIVHANVGAYLVLCESWRGARPKTNKQKKQIKTKQSFAYRSHPGRREGEVGGWREEAEERGREEGDATAVLYSKREPN